MRRELYLATVGATLLLIFVARAAFSQSTFGSLTGVVTDSSGAVVPNAQVQVTNEGTGAIRTVATGSAGDFNVPSLDLGTYRVRITATGFTAY